MAARILLVEDDLDNMNLMSYLLRAFRHSLQMVESGEAAIERVESQSFDLIICDINLPAMDGYEVCRWLKSHPKHRVIPVVAVTALAMVGDREKILAAGFDGYISKPIEPETFVPQLEIFLLPEKRSAAPITMPSVNSPLIKKARDHRILVVDNLPVNLALARSIFEPLGYQVVTAESMGQALDILRDQQFDVILSDINMADGTGYDFVAAVRSDPSLRDIPCILITSTFLESADQKRGLEMGADRCLTRPIDPDELLAEVEACLTLR